MVQGIRGADPGYQTLAIYYLYHAWRLTGNTELLTSLRLSGEFLTYFVHPDGTIGGLYGSRNTEVFYPGGIVAMSTELPVYKKLRKGLERVYCMEGMSCLALLILETLLLY